MGNIRLISSIYVGDVERTPRTPEPQVREERIHQEPNDWHLTAHGGDTERSLAATDGLGTIRDGLKQLADPVLAATQDRNPAVADAAQHDPEATLRIPRVPRPPARGFRSFDSRHRVAWGRSP
jgi:hypothetical protein